MRRSTRCASSMPGCASTWAASARATRSTAASAILKARGIQARGRHRRRRHPHHRRSHGAAVAGGDPPPRRSEHKVVTRIPLSDARCPPPGTTSAISMRTACATTTSSIRTPATPPARCAAPPVIAPTATQTDGMSKTAFVLGPEKALEIINRMPEYDAVFITPDGRILYSNGLRPPKPGEPSGRPAQR